MTISIPAALFDQSKILAQQLTITQGEFFERAIAEFVEKHQNPSPAEQSPVQGSGKSKRINQGDIYWVQVENVGDREAAIPHPHVIIQDNLFNHSRIHTVVTCALTSNIRRVSDTPGNLLLEVGEANLPRQSVVEVSKISSIEKRALGEYIGSLSAQRVEEIMAGMRFLQTSFFDR